MSKAFWSRVFWSRTPEPSGVAPNIPTAIQDIIDSTGWKSKQPLFVPAGSLSPVGDALAAAHAEIKQLKFLLASAPMIDVPTHDSMEFLRRAGARFGYIHPKTMAKISFQPVLHYTIMFPGSKTLWVLTSLMPEGRVLFSSIALPGIEKILAK